MIKNSKVRIQPGLHSWLISNLIEKIEEHESIIGVYYLYLFLISLLPGEE